ncbi:hypothetical protein [Photobacterium galatheae]|uniref:Uncharacterized protein n=1 Tax=Photobacterium galatheae TaxID=1654360 RepID=A0A066RSE3_9GAMM|nr:hypothetical protein [Photobacterium galatheae]KDM93375.1 hypothetical protein EA58_00450 [Photobacterium galatheae]MCM0146955.1 hypothetical protein [Photobacterium galatheae]
MSPKTEVRVSVDSEFLSTLQKRLNVSKSTDLTRLALTLLDWASEEVSHDRTILSATKQGKDVHRLVMTELSNIKKAKEEKPTREPNAG